MFFIVLDLRNQLVHVMLIVEIFSIDTDVSLRRCDRLVHKLLEHFSIRVFSLLESVRLSLHLGFSLFEFFFWRVDYHEFSLKSTKVFVHIFLLVARCFLNLLRALRRHVGLL